MFGFNKKEVATVITSDFELTYNSRNNNWCLFYSDVEFSFEGSQIQLPTVNLLDKYLSWVESYQLHIDQNIKEYINEGELGLDLTKTHLALIEVEKIDTIWLMILGDESWGDMGYDICIENGKIVNEGFSD